MILPDVNLLLYAYNPDSPSYRKANRWLENLLSATRPVAFAWVVLLGFLRISTSRHAFQPPFGTEDAIGVVHSWLNCPHVTILHPGDRHASLLFNMLEAAGTAGNLTTDAHLAALAVEYQCELHSTDTDFARFPGLKWRNPLK